MDVLKANTPWTREDCSRRAPGIEWASALPRCASGWGATIIVWHPAAITGIAKYREEPARQIVLTDDHALDEYRADTVRNLDPWYSAFGVKPAQRLYLAPGDRVRMW